MRQTINVELKIKERKGEYFVTIDHLKNTTPENAVYVLTKKYMRSHKGLMAKLDIIYNELTNEIEKMLK